MVQAQETMVLAVAGCPDRPLTIIHLLEALVPLRRLLSKPREFEEVFDDKVTRNLLVIRVVQNNILNNR
jgi:hypothetical protein